MLEFSFPLLGALPDTNLGFGGFLIDTYHMPHNIDCDQKTFVITEVHELGYHCLTLPYLEAVLINRMLERCAGGSLAVADGRHHP